MERIDGLEGYVKKLMGGEIPVYEQIKRFKEKTGMSERAYYRYKKAVKEGGVKKKSWEGVITGYEYRGRGCYFCGGKGNLVIHHIDFDRKNNHKNNLALLCKGCHSKLHYILSEMGITSRTAVITKMLNKTYGRKG